MFNYLVAKSSQGMNAHKDNRLWCLHLDNFTKCFTSKDVKEDVFGHRPHPGM